MKQTLQSLLAFGQGQLAKSGVPDPETDARYLLLEAFHMDMAHFLLNRNRELPDTEDGREMAGLYREMVGRRAKRIPLQQILGSQEFMGLEFFVNRHVLIPRQDTETLVELVLKEHPGKGEEILDLCTGSGCIAVSLAVRGKYGRITAVDLSKEALETAKKNCLKLLGQGSLAGDGRRDEDVPGPACRVKLLEGDLFRALDPETPLFDIIVSNPPYIPARVISELEPEVRDFEPRMALDGGGDGLVFYRRIALESGKYLKNGASVYLEIGCDQAEAVTGLFKEQGFVDMRVIRDAAGLDRVVAARKG